jgi:L-lysine exporter family protein LysE/ArgO
VLVVPLAPAVAGLLSGLSLIVAIGAQNALVLRQGLARQYVTPVVAVCAIADLLLIAAGVAGIGTVVEHAEWAIELVRWLGVAFLMAYGVRTLLAAREADSLEAARAGAASRKAAIVAALALTWLNPHVYLDTVLLLGSIANQHGADGRWWFGAGAMTASVLWFTGLGYGARAAHRLLATPRAWQVLDVLIGLTMIGIAVSLTRG